MSTDARKHVAALSVLLILSLGANLALYGTAKQFQKQRMDIESSIQGFRPTSGDPVPDLVGKTLDGAPLTIAVQGTGIPTLIYVFTPRCVWCTRNINNLKAMISASPGRFRFVGVALESEGLSEYLSLHQLPTDVLVAPSYDTTTRYGMAATPTTIVVATDGRIQRYWQGAYSPRISGEVEEFLGRKLPGVLAAPAQ